MEVALKGLWHETTNKVTTPKVKLNMYKDNIFEVDLVNMSKAERDEIIDDLTELFNGKVTTVAILGGVRLYATTNL